MSSLRPRRLELTFQNSIDRAPEKPHKSIDKGQQLFLWIANEYSTTVAAQTGLVFLSDMFSCGNTPASIRITIQDYKVALVISVNYLVILHYSILILRRVSLHIFYPFRDLVNIACWQWPLSGTRSPNPENPPMRDSSRNRTEPSGLWNGEYQSAIGLCASRHNIHRALFEIPIQGYE